MNKFVPGISKSVVNEYKNTMLVGNMNIPKLMIYAHQIDEEKIKEKKD